MRSLALCALLAASTAFANANGITGRSGKAGGTTCSSCHAQVGGTISAVIAGPNELTADQVGTYTLTLTGGPAGTGGVNIAASTGTLTNVDGTLRNNMTLNELYHAQARAFTANVVSWTFRFKAPATAGSATIFAAAQSTNNNGTTTGDQEKVITFPITVLPPNTAPAISTAAAANPATVAALTSALSVRATDDRGEAALIYTWASSPAGVTFSANGTNAAKNTVATFPRAGAFTLTVTAKDAQNATATSTVAVTVNQTYTSVAVTPSVITVAVGTRQQFAAAAKDQFGNVMTAPTAFTWSAPAASGTITAAGLYATGTAPGGPHTITAVSSGKTGRATVTIATGTPPRITQVPAAAVASNTTVRLTVLGADDGGEALLKYTWSATGPAPVTFSANGTNAAKQVVATLTKAGAYTFTAVVKDAANLQATDDVARTVAQVFTTAKVTPAAATVKPLESKQFNASALDQFNAPMSGAPVVSWLAVGSGTVSSDGMYRAGSTLGGPFEVRATVLGRSARADVTIANGGAPFITSQPTATPAQVTGRTAQLRVAADDEAGAAALTYAWESMGPAPVTFSSNATATAKQTTATFAAAGTYTLTVTATNAANKTASADLTVEVQASAETLELQPTFVALKPSGSASFTARPLDQFGAPMTSAGAVTFNVGRAGTIDENGVFTAFTTTGVFTISAAVAGLRGSAVVMIDGQAPTVSLVAPQPLSVLKGTARLEADVTDDYTVASVTFFANDQALGTADHAPFGIDLDSTMLLDGSYQLHAEAFDAAGNSAKTSPIEIQVWNDESRPAPAPSSGGGGCSAAGGALPSFLVLLVVAVLSLRRRLVMKPLLASLLLVASAVSAQGMSAEQRERCATRLSVNLLGQPASAALLASANPQNDVDAMLASPQFIDRFATFINAKFNAEPSPYAVQEPTYYLTKHVLTNGKPWNHLFIGPYKLERVNPQATNQPPVITDDPNGLGYFFSADWRARYLGNELQRYRLVHAYRIINNVLGIELQAAVNTDGVDTQGRKSAACSGCHYQPTYGLDLIARVLPRGNAATPAEAPQTLLGGKVIHDERELITEMVNSPDFRFNTCRLATLYAYGRKEFKCEGPVFDACMAAFASRGTMQAALSAIARHPTYCQ